MCNWLFSNYIIMNRRGLPFRLDSIWIYQIDLQNEFYFSSKGLNLTLNVFEYTWIYEEFVYNA